MKKSFNSSSYVVIFVFLIGSMIGDYFNNNNISIPGRGSNNIYYVNAEEAIPTTDAPTAASSSSSSTTVTDDDDATVDETTDDGTTDDETTDDDVVSLVDIPSTAIAAGVFETLVAALSAADLVDVLSGDEGPFTVFAPTDDAFAALPDGLVTCLLEPDNKGVLTSILTYHVVSGEILSKDLEDGAAVETLQGEDVTVDLTDGVKINDSTVIKADVLATNGVIHVINAVLVPPSIDVTAFLETCNSAMETMDESSSSSTSSYVPSFLGVTTIISIITTGAIVSILL